MPRLLFATAAIALPRRQLLTLPLSMALHSVLIATLVVVPLLARSEMPDVVRTFYVDPLVIAAAPPPPAGRPGVKATKGGSSPTTKNSNNAGLVAPTTEPSTIERDSGPDLESGCVGQCVEGGFPFPTSDTGHAPIVGGLPPAQSEIRREPLRAKTEVSEPRKLHHVPPVYPPTALLARLQGDVVLDCVIGTEGRVGEISVLSGPPMLREAAIEAVQQWLYMPTLVNGVRMPVVLSVTVQFRISSR